MKDDKFIRDAIDESLSGVRFTQRDMRSVLRTIRSREEEPVRCTPARRPLRLDLVLSFAMLLIIALPIGLFALRTQGLRTTHIAAAPGASAAPAAQTDPTLDRILTDALVTYTESETEAIRIARACFESVCDTSVFTFEEYAVSVSAGEDGAQTVTLESIYGNGCRFSVTVQDGRAVSHSTPQLATVPTYLDTDAPEIQAWYARHGAQVYAWPQDVQAEFSRRYEGAALREASAGELTAQEAAALAAPEAAKALESLGYDAEPVCYPQLFAEHTTADGKARYVVTCLIPEWTGEFPAPRITVSFTATGEDVQVSW